jgi:ketosteroid isomerase-like protein
VEEREVGMMRNSWGAVWLFIFLTGMPAAAVSAAGRGGSTASLEEKAVKDTILALEKSAMERWRQGDPWGWAEISSEEVSYIDPGRTKPIVGLEEYRDFLRQVEGKVHYQGSEFLAPEVVVIGDAAVLSYNYRSSSPATDSTAASETLWNTTEVYFKENGQWKIVHTHWSFVGQKLPDQLEIPLPVQVVEQKDEGILGELLALETAAMKRWRQGDPGGFLELSAPEVTYFDSETPQRLNGREALRTLYEKVEGQVSFEVMEFIAPRVHRRGDLAVLTYRFFTTRLRPDGSIARRTPWNCSEVYVRIDGQWKIMHTHWSYIKGEKS